MTEPPPDRAHLHPAEHRAYRELYAACRQLIERWRRLAAALADTDVGKALEHAQAQVEALLTALERQTAIYGLHGRILAQGIGARFAEVRAAVGDRAVDTGAVVRLAVLDIEHIATLLAHLRELARTRGDTRLADFCEERAKVMRDEVKTVRKAAVRLGRDPDRVAAPLDDSPLSQVAHRAGWLLGSVGEAVDRAAELRRTKS